MIDMQEATQRLHNLNNSVSPMFLNFLMFGEDKILETIKNSYPQKIEQFVLLSRMEQDAAELLQNENIWTNTLEMLPAEMAIDPTIGFQSVKDTLKSLGFETREQYSEWAAQNPRSFLTFLRTSITAIQAYFDLGKQANEEGDDSVVEFIFNVMGQKITNNEQEAIENANQNVNNYLWQQSTNNDQIEYSRRIISFAPLLRQIYSDTTWSGDSFVNQSLPKISDLVVKISELESIEKGEDLGEALIALSNLLDDFNANPAIAENRSWGEKYESICIKVDAHIAFNAILMHTEYAIEWPEAAHLILEYIQSEQLTTILNSSPWGSPKASLGIDFVEKVIAKIID